MLQALTVDAAENVLPLAPSARITEARKDEHGFLRHEVESEFQAGQTEIRVLLPDQLRAEHKILFVLPVEAGDGRRWGDAQAEIKKLDLANKHGLICVYPTFSHLPWYVDHPTDKTIRQETYFLRVVVPFVEQKYPAARMRDGRLLLGFSKSGWGAWSLLLRHPDVFGKAAAWDAPLAMDRGHYGMETISGTPENFERYRIFNLLKQAAPGLGAEKRLALLGYDNFREQTQRTEELLLSLKIPHTYRDGPQRKHHWNTGWVAAAVECLLAPGQ